MSFFSHHIGHIQSMLFMSVDVDLGHWAEVMLVRFLHCYSLPTMSVLSSLEGTQYVQPTLRDGKLCSLSFRVE